MNDYKKLFFCGRFYLSSLVFITDKMFLNCNFIILLQYFLVSETKWDTFYNTPKTL